MRAGAFVDDFFAIWVTPTVRKEPPVRRGSRTYDDGKFFKSLKKQAEQGKMLSDSQMAALLKIASRYAAKIENYTDLVTALGATIAPTMASTGEATVGMVEDKNATKAKIAVAPNWRPAGRN